jgi:histidyl-tRNA synthetase
VLVAVTREEERPVADEVARALRTRGIATEVAPSAARFGKQIRHADRRGIPYVWFPPSGGAAADGGAGGGGHEVKDIRSGDQTAADPTTWTPPAEDLRPTVVAR